MLVKTLEASDGRSQPAPCFVSPDTPDTLQICRNRTSCKRRGTDPSSAVAPHHQIGALPEGIHVRTSRAGHLAPDLRLHINWTIDPPALQHIFKPTTFTVNCLLEKMTRSHFPTTLPLIPSLAILFATTPFHPSGDLGGLVNALVGDPHRHQVAPQAWHQPIQRKAHRDLIGGPRGDQWLASVDPRRSRRWREGRSMSEVSGGGEKSSQWG